MCGITGSVNYKITDENLAVLKHRGPDYQELQIRELGKNTIYLAHTRLSILDLSAAGNQPMFTQCGKYAIVFNGEIYNHLDLRKKIAFNSFKSHSDTETILYYIKEFGIKAVKDFNGIFALCFYDFEAAKLYIVRDRFGVKPVYYHIGDQAIIFASELKLLLKVGVEKSINESALDMLLSLRYNTAPETIFKEIFKLKASHCLEYNINDHSATFYNYCKQPYLQNKHIKLDEAIEEYQFLLNQAVKRQLLSDVPVGLFLSGGLDSALLGMIMSQSSTSPIQSYTVGFEGKGNYNELSDARISAELINSVHHEEMISQEEYFSYFKRSFFHTEEPIAEATIPALYHVSKMSSFNNKVVISGQGADEPLAGYHRYKGEQLISKYGGLLKVVPYEILRLLFKNNESYQKGVYSAQYDDEIQRFVAIYTIFSDEMKKGLFKSGKMVRDKELYHYFEDFINADHNQTDSLNKLLYLDTRTMLPDNLLLFNDKITMAHSIENRVPFLDNDLVDFLETLPSRFKLNGNVHKYLEKKAAVKWLPDAIINRKKRGFETPIDEWFKKPVLYDEMISLITETDSFTSVYFNKNYIIEMLELHKSNRRNYKKQLFTIYSLELWYREFYKKF